MFKGQLYFKNKTKQKKTIYKTSVLKAKQDADLNYLSEYSEKISGTNQSKLRRPFKGSHIWDDTDAKTQHNVRVTNKYSANYI